MSVTLREVAKRAGVDISTVSRVIRDDPAIQVRPETRERILRTVAELNYRPNHLARSLKTRSTKTLGMLVPDITNPLFPAIYKGIEDTARQLGYSVILANTGTRNEQEDPNLWLLRDKRVDGIILATAFTSDEVVARLEREGFPVVLVNRRASVLTERFVAPDDMLGAEMAVKHLIDLGHTRIGHISGPLYTETGLNRFKGYRRCLKEHGLPFDARWVQEADFREETGYRAMESLLHLPDPPTAIFAANDLLAMGAIRRIQESALSVPNDVSVVGFNDLPWTDRICPPLTTMHLPLYDMGAAAARMLVRVLQGERLDPPYLIVQPELIVRGSTASPARP